MDVSGLREYYENLPRLVESSKIDRKEPVQQHSSCYRSDPFELLPYEILFEVLNYLPIESVVMFKAASCAAKFPLSNGTWKRRIKSDMPWLWDLFNDHARKGDVSETTVDWKKVHASLESRSRFESRHHISGLVNRRRIWNICSQIAVLYASKHAIVPKPPKSGNEDVCEDVFNKTVCSLLVEVTRFPEPSDTRFTTFMLLGLGDLHHGSSLLRTYWNDDERLIGVSMTMKGRSPRLFGHQTSIEKRVKSMVIEEGDWLQKVTLNFDYCGIKGLTVRICKTTQLLCFGLSRLQMILKSCR